MRNATFIFNTAFTKALISYFKTYLDSTLTLENVIFQNNKVENALIDFTNSKLIIINANFIDNDA